MIIKKIDADNTKAENLRGGSGTISVEAYLKHIKMESKLTNFNVMTIQPGDFVGYHQHIGNEEVYFILSGKAFVKDNDKEEILEAGDLIFTGNGSFHSIKNIGDEELKFATFIVTI